MRLVESTTLGDSADHVGKLNGSSRDCALTDGHGNRLTGVPLLVKNALLPSLGRHQAGLLAGEIDARPASQAKIGAIKRDSIDSHLLAHVIKEHVAGMHDSFVQINVAVTFFVPIVEDTPI